MNAFAKCQQLEIRSLNDLLPFFKSQSLDGQLVVTAKGPLSEFLQRTVGDILFNSHAASLWGIEIKSEESDLYGNFFLETWSNCCFRKQTPGWMYTLRTDILVYYFVAQQRFYSVPFRKLWEWAFITRSTRGRGRIFDFPEKPQGKHQQLNQTWGRCVPIEVIRKEVGFRVYEFNGFEFEEVIEEQEDDLPLF